MANDEIERRRAWMRDGFFIVRRQVRPERVRELSEACDHVLQQVRGASSTHVTAFAMSQPWTSGRHGIPSLVRVIEPVVHASPARLFTTRSNRDFGPWS